MSSPHGGEFGVIDIFRNPIWRPPPSWILKTCKFGTFHHVNSVVLEVYIKFGSNICYSHWDRLTSASDFHLMTSRELTSGFDFWSRGLTHGHDASFHVTWCRYFYPVRSYWPWFRNWRWWPPPYWIFSLSKFGHSGVLIVWYLCSVPNFVQTSVIITQIDTHMLQTYIWWRHAY